MTDFHCVTPELLAAPVILTPGNSIDPKAARDLVADPEDAAVVGDKG